MDAMQQEIFGRREVGIENRDELACRRLHAFRQRSGFEAVTICSVVIADGIAQGGIALDQCAGDVDGLVGRVVKNLNVKLLARIVQLANGFEQALDHVLFVENRQLHGNAGQVFESGGRPGRAVPAVLVIKVDEDVAVHAVSGEQNQDDEVRNKQRKIECIRVIDPSERRVEEVLANIRSNALRRRENHDERAQNGISNQTKCPVKLLFYRIELALCGGLCRPQTCKQITNSGSPLLAVLRGSVGKASACAVGMKLLHREHRDKDKHSQDQRLSYQERRLLPCGSWGIRSRNFPERLLNQNKYVAVQRQRDSDHADQTRRAAKLPPITSAHCNPQHD